jgi:hypothetical protein
MGGPLGFLEYVVESLGTQKGRSSLLKRFKDRDGCVAVAHILVRCVGSIDPSVAADTLRFLSESEVNEILSGSIDLGLKLLQTEFQWDPLDKELQGRLKNFNPAEVFQKFQKAHSDYVSRQSAETERRRSQGTSGSSGYPDTEMDESN